MSRAVTEGARSGWLLTWGALGWAVRLRDVEKVAMALAAAGAELAGPEETPLAQLMTDLTTGKLMEEVLQEPNLTFLSIIIEAKCREERLRDVLKALQKSGAGGRHGLFPGADYSSSARRNSTGAQGLRRTWYRPACAG
ncbi:MAG: hypothetical protein ACOX2S_10290 [bacterium]